MPNGPGGPSLTGRCPFCWISQPHEQLACSKGGGPLRGPSRCPVRQVARLDAPTSRCSPSSTGAIAGMASRQVGPQLAARSAFCPPPAPHARPAAAQAPCPVGYGSTRRARNRAAVCFGGCLPRVRGMSVSGPSPVGSQLAMPCCLLAGTTTTSQLVSPR